MRRQISTGAIIASGILAIKSTSLTFLLSGGVRWHWALAAVVISLVPIILGPTRYRIIGTLFLIVCAGLTYQDVKFDNDMKTKSLLLHPKQFCSTINFHGRNVNS
jgi:hypothetical protein